MGSPRLCHAAQATAAPNADKAKSPMLAVFGAEQLGSVKSHGHQECAAGGRDDFRIRVGDHRIVDAGPIPYMCMCEPICVDRGLGAAAGWTEAAG